MRVCRGRETGRVRKPGPRGSRLSPRQPKGSHPCEHWSGGWSSSWWGVGASREWDQAQSSGGDISETSPEEQDQEDQEPPADLNTGTRPYNEGGNLILRASNRGRGNGLANQMPDQASYEVQGKIRYLTMLARGGSRVVYTLDREPPLRLPQPDPARLFLPVV